MSDADVVLALEKTCETSRAGNLETVNEVADGWLGVGPAGETMTKDDLLGMLAARPNLFDTTAYSDVRLSLFSTTAVIVSSFHGVGRELELKQRYMRVYAKRENRWRCVATQIIPTPAI